MLTIHQIVRPVTVCGDVSVCKDMPSSMKKNIALRIYYKTVAKLYINTATHIIGYARTIAV